MLPLHHPHVGAVTRPRSGNIWLEARDFAYLNYVCFWSERQDLNLWPFAPKANALAGLSYTLFGAPCRTCTHFHPLTRRGFTSQRLGGVFKRRFLFEFV